MQGALACLRRFRTVLADYELDAVRVVATSAMRVARNGAAFSGFVLSGGTMTCNPERSRLLAVAGVFWLAQPVISTTAVAQAARAVSGDFKRSRFVIFFLLENMNGATWGSLNGHQNLVLRRHADA